MHVLWKRHKLFKALFTWKDFMLTKKKIFNSGLFKLFSVFVLKMATDWLLSVFSHESYLLYVTPKSHPRHSSSVRTSRSVSLSSACHLTSERDSHSLFTNYRSTSVTCRICAVLYINLLTRGSRQNNYFRRCWMAVLWLVILL